jgi:photosystem II stability/assembly factor-like uncharacterized protein
MVAFTLPRHSRASVGAAAFALLLLASAGPSRAADDRPAREQAFEDWFSHMDAYFEQNPEERASGFGWKPYNRIKWDFEGRGVAGRFVSPREDLEAVRARNERFGDPRSRSAYTWFSLGPENHAGRMLSLDFHPSDANIVYAGGAQGGVWKSTDNGVTWVPKTDELPNLAIGGLAVSRTDPTIVVIGTGEPIPAVGALGGIGIFRSTDSGETWSSTDHTSDGFHVVRCGPDGSFLAGSDNGLWRSTDDGATWSSVRDGGDYYDVVWKPGDANTVFTVRGNAGAGGGANVKVSTDDGVTWAKAGSGQPISPLIGKSRLAVSAANPEYVYALFASPGTGNTVTGLYLSTDGGADWTAQNTNSGEFGGQTWYNLLLGVDQVDPTIVIGGGQALRRSTDSGVTFSGGGAGVHADFHIMRHEPGTGHMWLGCDGGLYRSTEAGANGSFAERDFGIVTYQFYDICVNNGSAAYYVMGGAQDNGTDKWSGTTAWTHGLGADGFDCNISSTTGTVVMGESQFGDHNRSTDSGATFGSFNAGIVGNGPWHTPVEMDPNNHRHLYTVTTGPSALWRNRSVFASWVQVGSFAANSISISPVDGDCVWTGSGTQVRVSTDDGDTWITSSPLGVPGGGITRVEAHPSVREAAFATFTNGRIAYTTDLGASWTERSGDFPSEWIVSFAINPANEDQWFVGTNTGVYMTTDFGDTWEPLGDATLPNVVVSELEIQASLQKLVAGTYGRGAFEMEIPQVGNTGTPSVTVERTRDLMLDPPMPNPMRDRTMLRFAARSGEPVKLAVYDVRGRMVTPLADLPAGDGVVRTTPWFSEGVPSGVYFVRLSSGGRSVSRKVIVTR